MTSAAKIAANRRNALRSTGPRTAGGKSRSARNGRRHGLNTPARADPRLATAVAVLARSIAGSDAGAEQRERAERVAAAHVDVMRVRQAREALYGMPLSADELATRLARLEYYERRARSRRKRTMSNFDSAGGN